MQEVFNILTYPSADAKIRWFAKATSSFSRANNLGGIVTSAKELENVARLSRNGMNVYVTLNPTNQRICKRINVTDVTRWAFILIDLDPLDPPKTFMNDYRAFTDEVISIMKNSLRMMHWCFGAPAVIRTGRGVQMWLRVDPRACDTASWRQFYSNVNRGFLHELQTSAPIGWRIDMTADLARVARLPGTINQKTGEKAELVETGAVLDPGSTDYLCSTYITKGHLHQTFEEMIAHESDRTWEEVRDELTLRAKNYLTLGAVEGNRHESCQHLCKTLHERGVTKASAYEALLFADDANQPELGARECAKILEQVYREETK